MWLYCLEAHWYTTTRRWLLVDPCSIIELALSFNGVSKSHLHSAKKQALLTVILKVVCKAWTSSDSSFYCRCSTGKMTLVWIILRFFNYQPVPLLSLFTFIVYLHIFLDPNWSQFTFRNADFSNVHLSNRETLNSSFLYGYVLRHCPTNQGNMDRLIGETKLSLNAVLQSFPQQVSHDLEWSEWLRFKRLYCAKWLLYGKRRSLN